MGQSAAASGVMFQPGSPSIPGERVTSGLVWRFGTLDCISNNLDYFGSGFGSGSLLDIGSHCFYVAKPFLEEVTDVLDPLCDADSEDGKSSDFYNMVEVLALEEDGGGDPPRSACPPLERSPPPEHGLPPPERDVLDTAIMDLHAPLDITMDPVKIFEDLEQTRHNLLKEVVDINDMHRRILSMINEYNIAHGFTPAGDGPSRVGQVRQRGHELGAELNQAAPSAKLPPIITKPTYSTPTKNLHAARYITSKLDGL
jgi:hypothetical protein